MSLRVFIFCFLFVLTAFYGEEDKEIKVLFTGNTHGYSERFTDKDGTLKGGAAARKTVIDSVTGDLKRTDILLLDAGGFVNGTPQSIFTNGKAEISALNQLGYDAVGVGFTEIMDSFKDFSAYNKESRFYFISSNIQAKKKGIAESYYVKTINGVKVAVVSFVREELITAMSSVAQKDFNIDDPYNTAMELVTAIKNKEFKSYTLESVAQEMLGEGKLISGKDRHDEIEILFKTNKEKLVKLGLKRAKQFSWEKTAKETLKVYNEVRE